MLPLPRAVGCNNAGGHAAGDISMVGALLQYAQQYSERTLAVWRANRGDSSVQKGLDSQVGGHRTYWGGRLGGAWDHPPTYLHGGCRGWRRLGGRAACTMPDGGV